MELTLQLTPALHGDLLDKAKDFGVEVETLASNIVGEHLHTPNFYKSWSVMMQSLYGDTEIGGVVKNNGKSYELRGITPTGKMIWKLI
ncbi:hypothetical protein [Photobacterium swingsii]|uniref:hypothetical protein n=1 Tax=Photobacterium swingsii TaxID=680026 RepID=UPI0040678C1D